MEIGILLNTMMAEVGHIYSVILNQRPIKSRGSDLTVGIWLIEKKRISTSQTVSHAENGHESIITRGIQPDRYQLACEGICNW